MRLKGAAKIAAINVALLLVGAIILEASLGDWWGPTKWVHLNVLKDLDIQIGTDHLYPPFNQKIRYRRDGYGLRGSYEDPASIDVLTVGGSTTDQRYIDDARTWQSVLVEAAASRGKKISVVNAGVDGRSSVGHLRDFEGWFKEIPNLRPRFILFYIGVNDFNVEQHAGYDLQLEQADSGPTLLQTISSKSVLFYMFRTVRGAISAKYIYKVAHTSIKWDAVAWTDKGLLQDYEKVMAPALDRYSRRLEGLANATRKIGARPIFVTQPRMDSRQRADGKVWGADHELPYGKLTINGVDTHFMMALQNRRTMDTCKRIEAICINLAKELPFEEQDFYDYFHNTPAGAEKIGRFLASKLASTLQ